MTRMIKVAAVSLSLALAAAGCGNFLTGDKLTNDPNNPSQATAQQLFLGVQANMFSSQENSVAMTVCMWMQQCMGVGGRFVANYAHYTVNEFSWDGNWFQVYTGGGLVDLRKIENIERAAGDSTYLGIAKIWEAFDMGVAADLWGDVPYSQAVGSNPTPGLDTQASVYAAVQTLLSDAIAELTNGSGIGPLGNDLVYGGDRAKWIAAAHTLKARFLLHTIEANPGTKNTIYGNAITEANAGIASPAGDLLAFHSTATPERNIWYQFQTTTFGQDLVAGKTLVNLMKARNDPRLPAYFAKNTTAGWQSSHKYAAGNRILEANGNVEQVDSLPRWQASHKYKAGDRIADTTGHVAQVDSATTDSLSGSTQPAWSSTVGSTLTDNHVYWKNVGAAYTSGITEPTWPPTIGDTTSDNLVHWTNVGLPYGGQDVKNTQTNISNLNGIAGNVSLRMCPTSSSCGAFRQPLVTYQENELILAEAYQQTSQDGTALTHLNNARGVPGLSTLSGITTGTGLLDSIMVEKYVTLYQNIEVWNDYRRMCRPALTPFLQADGASPVWRNKIPGRLYYSGSEMNVNPNIPSPSTQTTTNGFRNPNDTADCP